VRILTAKRINFRNIIYSSDSGTLYGFGWGRARDGLHVWNLGAETEHVELRHVERQVWGCWPLPDGRLLLGIGDEVARCVVAVTTAAGGLNRLPVTSLYHASAITISPAGDRFVSVDRSVYDAELLCHRLEGDTAREVWQRPFGQNYSVGLGVEYHPDGERLLSTETHQHPTTRVRTPVARWRSAADGSPLGDPIPLTVSTCLTRLLADGSRLIAMAGAALLSYDLTNPTAKPKKVTSGNRLHFTSFAVHPQHRRVLAICNDQSVREYDAVTMKQIRAYDWKIGNLRCLAIAPDGLTAAAVGAGRKVIVWDLE
jgi:WD40 repeat protein